MNTDAPNDLEAINEAYQKRVDGLDSADKRDSEAAEKAEKESGIESVDTPLPEEQRFVANPEDLRKTVSSEEEFSKGLSDGDDDIEPLGDGWTPGSGENNEGNKVSTERADTPPTAFPVEADDDFVGTSEDDEEPNKSWTKARLVDYIVDVDDELKREDLEKMTKAELLDRFIDEG